MMFPATACFVQKKLGAKNAACLDVSAACAGFLFAVEIAQQFIMSRTYDAVLVIGAEKLSWIVNWEDRNTCVLFGDGAGAAILQNRPNSHGLLTAVMGADGEKCFHGCCVAGKNASSVWSFQVNPPSSSTQAVRARRVGSISSGTRGRPAPDGSGTHSRSTPWRSSTSATVPTLFGVRPVRSCKARCGQRARRSPARFATARCCNAAR